MRPREVDAVCCEYGLEQLLGGLLTVEADDLVGNRVDRLERPNRGEVGVGAVEKGSCALDLRATHRERRPR